MNEGNGRESSAYRMTLASRALAATDVYDAVLNGSESFEVQHTGAHLAYLMGAVLKGGTFQAWFPQHARFIGLLRRFVPADHLVWESVELMGVDTALPSHVHRLLLKEEEIPAFVLADYPTAKRWRKVLSGEEAT